MAIRNNAFRILSFCACLVALTAGTAGAQLPTAGGAPLGTANNYTALARGFTAIGINPAGLAMPGSPGFSMTLAPVQARGGIDPIGLGDIKEFEGTTIPFAKKEQWMDEIIRAGGLTGSGGAEVSAIAFNVKNFGFQVSSVADLDATLNEDAMELLLFGNAGRDGVPHDFELDGSELNGFAATTFAASYGHALNLPLGYPGGKFAVGATLKYTVGHALLVARDGGSLLVSDPISVDLKFPAIMPSSDYSGVNSGSGVGIDVGAAWQGGPWTAGATIQNLITTFEWDIDQMAYRPGEAFFNDLDNGSDFDERPASEAPSALLDEVKSMGFDPRLVLGGAFQAPMGVTVTADIRHQLGEGLTLGERTHAGMGLEYSPFRVLPLRTGFAVVNGGVQIAGGAGLHLGPVRLDGAAIVQPGDAAGGMLALSFGQ